MYAFSGKNNTVVVCLYFSSFVLVSSFLMMNLFVMIIIQTYDDLDTNPASIFQKEVKKFTKYFDKYADDYNGEKISFRNLVDLFYDLDEFIGITEDINVKEALKLAMSLDFDVD